MTPALGLLASQLAILAVGYSLLRALGLAELRVADARLIGLSYLAGWASTGVLVTLALVVGVGENLPVILALVAAQIVGFLFLGRRAKPPGAPAPPVKQSRHPLAIAVCWISGAVIAVATLSASAVASKGIPNAYGDFDAFDFWIPKAVIIHQSHGLNVGLWTTFAHPEYPPLAPAMDAYTFFFTGVHPSLLVTQRTILGIAFLFSLVVLLGRFVPRWLVLPFVATLSTAPWSWPRLASVDVDAPLTYFVSSAAIAGFLWLHERRRCWLILTGLFLAAGSLTKLEGFFFSEVLAVTLVVGAAIRYRRAAAPALAMLAAPLLIALWWVWLRRHGLSAANGDYHLTDMFDPHYLSSRASRLSTVLSGYRREGDMLLSGALGGWHVPGVTWWMLVIPFVLAFVLAGRRHLLLAAVVAAWSVAAVAGLTVIYWIGRLPVHWYVEVTVGRLAPTILIAAGALVTLLLGIEIAGGSRAGHDPANVSGRAISRTSRGFIVALSAVVTALVVAALADSRPSVHRTGPVDAAELGRELGTQFTLELNSAGYPYQITAACNQAWPQGLDFACLAQTKGPVGNPSPKVLYWHISVSCVPAATSEPRCVSSQGEALN